MTERTLAHGESLPAEADGDPVAAHTLGVYRLGRRLGEGGMAEVCLAEQTAPVRRQVAVKLIKAGMDSQRVLARFEAERQALALMVHPAIARVYDGGSTPEGRPYFVMEYVPGAPITEHCDRDRLPVRARLELFVQVCEGVQHAHQKAIIHRDLKPSNVLVAVVDGRPLPKIIDFGIAKAIDQRLADQPLFTELGSLVGTPEYMSPEQADPAIEDIDTRADVYSLGAMLYELLSGELPFASEDLRGSSLDELRRKIREVDPPAPSAKVGRAAKDGAARAADARQTDADTLSRELRGDLDAIAMKALEKDRARRYGSASELAADVGRYLRNEPVLARRAGAGYRLRKYVRRNRTAASLAALSLLATAAGVVGTVSQARTVRRQRDFALGQLSRAEAINDLNSFLLSDAAPSGKPFTASQLLARAEHVTQRQQSKPDASGVEILIAIGRQYAILDEDANARRMLTKAYELSRGLAEQSTRAKASCALAGELARAGELPRAEALVQEGLQELPDEPQFALDRIFCLLRASEVSREGRDQRQGVERALAAQRALRASPIDSQLLELRVLMDIAESYRTADRPREASAAFEQAWGWLGSLGRDDTETAGTLLNNWGMTLWDQGLPRDAERVFRRAIEISASDASQHGVSPMLLNNEARVLRDLGRLAEAANYAERAYARAKDADDQVVVNQSLIVRAIVYREAGDASRAAEMISEVEPRLRRALPPGHIAFASVLSEKALNTSAKGDPPAGLELMDQAVALAEGAIKAGGTGAAFLNLLLLRRSGLHLQLGQAQSAAADAERALQGLKARAAAGGPSSSVGRAWLSLGRALEALGKSEAARAAGASALEQLEGSLGPEHADTRAARQLAALIVPPG
jgi:eukaryotic-like serine/threonine-protein kinase